MLYEVPISVEERMGGYLDEKTKNEIEIIARKWAYFHATETKSRTTHTGMEHFFGAQFASFKDVADSVEALTAVYLIRMGLRGAATILRWLHVLPENVDVDTLLYKLNENPVSSVVNDHIPNASDIERNIGYRFKNRAYLLQAFTHPSYISAGITESYQRLEFLGDAILDILITGYIYENCGNLSPGDLTDLRSALVNNTTFACLATRYGLHTALLYASPSLCSAIDKFVLFQEQRHHDVGDMIIWILVEEDDCNLAETVDIPKPLGDIFESIVGAIYLDTGKNLEEVWNVVYPLMKREIDQFSNNVPKNPIRKLYEIPGAQPKFHKPVPDIIPNRSMVLVEVMVAGKLKHFQGLGVNAKKAKFAAAKLALKSLLYNNH